MQTRMYSIYDLRSGHYNPPFVETHQAYAQRRMEDSIKNPDSRMSKEPENFCLYEIGVFKEETGRVVHHPEFIYIDCGEQIAEELGIKTRKQLTKEMKNEEISEEGSEKQQKKIPEKFQQKTL